LIVVHERFRWTGMCAVLCAMLVSISAIAANTDAKNYERTFRESPTSVKKILSQLQNSLSGRLPVLDGFAEAGEHGFDHYQRAYFQATVEVNAASGGGSIVRVNSKITAWYTDTTPSRSGYRLLPSNGRIEADILEQLSAQLTASLPSTGTPADVEAAPHSDKSEEIAEKPESAAPTSTSKAPSLPDAPSGFSSSRSRGLTTQDLDASRFSARAPEDAKNSKLQSELEQLQEIVRNQSHPKNLAAVKKSGTAVVSTPSLSAKPLFLASAHDEFEILNFNQDWVHVRVSGLSRGWIWRNDLEMPDDVPDTQAAPPKAVAADLFHVVREERSPFPGDWEPLRGKNVKLISVQTIDEAAKDTGPQMKLEYAKYLLDKNYAEVADKSKDLAGIVLIFDSSDGGMIAAAQATLSKWKDGTLSDAALWHNCFFDPPETFLATTPAGSH